MATTGPTVDEMTVALERMTGQMEKARESSDSILDGFTKLLQTLVPLGAAYKAISSMSGQWNSNIKTALGTLSQTTSQLLLHRQSEKDALATAVMRWRSGDLSLRQLRTMCEVFRQTNDLHKAQLRLLTEIDAVGRSRLLVGGLIAEQAAMTLVNTHKINEAVQESNADFWQRLKLTESIARTQQQTGANIDHVVSAAKSLVRYNLDAKGTFQDNLKTVVMLHNALGMSTDDAAELAAVTENYARVSFQRVADVVATIVDQTAMAASEVKNLGVELTRTLALIQPGSQTTMPGILQAMSGYEGALKEVTGRVGTFQKFIGHMATPEGMMTSGVLGIGPKMMQTEAGLNAIMSRFDAFAKSQIGNAEGMERSIRLAAVGQQMNLTANEVNEMILAIERYRGQTVKEITLKERYALETKNLNQGVTQLVSSLSSLLQQGLHLPMSLLAGAVNIISSIVKAAAGLEYVGYVAMVVVPAAVVYLTARLWNVAMGFIAVAKTANEAAKSLLNYAFTRAGLPVPGAATPSSFGASLSKMGAALFSSVTAPLWVIAVGVGTVAFFAHKLWAETKQIREDSDNLHKKFIGGSLSLQQVRQQQFYSAVREGREDDAAGYMRGVLREMRTRLETDNVPVSEIENRLKEGAQSIADEANNARYVRTIMGEEFIGRGKFDRDALVNKQITLTTETLKYIRELVALGKKRADDNIAAEQARKEAETKATLDRVKRESTQQDRHAY